MPRKRKEPGEYIIEFVSLGNAVKVTAVDPETLTEVSIVGAPQATQAQLSELAVRKLRYVLERENKSS